MDESITAYISLGGNLGGEAGLFGRALDRMDTWPGVRVTARSGLYQTEPQGDADQPWFTNQVAALSCALGVVTPASLLHAMLRLEKELGRTRDADRRFAPRTLDLDLLLFGDIILQEEGVCVPHPRMTKRAFVLVPLLEIAPTLRIPEDGAASEHLARLRYRLDDHTIFQEE